MADIEQIADLKKVVEATQELPAMPALAVKLFNLKKDPTAGADELARVIELDPGLAGQIVRYATSPFFGYRGRVESIQDAIARVLGFEKAMNIATGLALGKTFSMSLEGPLGLKALWRHSVYSAALMQLLAEAMPKDIKPKPGLAYLAGLLHNIGFLMIGHLFKREFRILNETIESQPEKSIQEIEVRLLGVEHTELGVWLMRSWRMPPEVVTTAFEHHNENYRGQFAVYANLALVADRMLRRRDIGDAPSDELPRPIVRELRFEEQRVTRIFDKLLESERGLEAIAREMAGGV